MRICAEAAKIRIEGALRMIDLKQEVFFLDLLVHIYSSVSGRGGHAQLFLCPQSQFSNLKEALQQSQFRNFLKKCCSQPQLRNSAIAFFMMSPTSNLQLESFISAIFGMFLAVESGRGKKKNRRYKSRATVPLRQVLGFQSPNF